MNLIEEIRKFYHEDEDSVDLFKTSLELSWVELNLIKNELF